MSVVNISRRSGRLAGLLAAVATACWLAAAPAQAAGEPPLLLSPLPVAGKLVTPKSAPADRGVLRERPVSANVSFLGANAGTGGASTRLELFDGLVVTLDTDRVDWRTLSNYAYFGKVRGNPNSDVVLTVVDGVLTGQITLAGDGADPVLYHIEADADGTQWLQELDPAAFPEDHPAGNELLFAPTEAKAKPQGTAKADSGATIDVMVVYSNQTATAAGTAIGSQIQYAVDMANKTYANSGVTTRLRLVYSGLANYSESGDFNTDLNRLTSTTDGYMDDVHTLRNSYAADLVSLFIENKTYCGLGWIGPSASKGFTVVSRSCAGSNYSLAHEIGHNFGARHDTYVDGSTTPYAYGHGEVNVSGKWRTVMSYNNECSAAGVTCTRIPYWSTPNVSYGSPAAPLGTATGADNVRVINGNAATVANFRVSGTTTSTTTCSFALSPTSASVGASGGTGSTTVTASSGCAWNAASNASWLTIASTTATSGNGTLSFSAAANAGAARSAAITIGTQSFTVSQASGCTYTVTPTSVSIGSGAATGTIAVSSGCSWTASSGASWITITSGSSGSGNGSVAYSVAGNTGSMRTGNLTVAGQTVTFTQAAATTSSTTTTVSADAMGVSPTSLSFGTTFVGRKGKTLASKVTNTGSASITLTAVALSGTNPGDFRYSGTCVAGMTLAPAQACSLQYTFYPTAAGTRSATVTASTATRSVSVGLVGTGKPSGK